MSEPRNVVPPSGGNPPTPPAGSGKPALGADSAPSPFPPGVVSPDSRAHEGDDLEPASGTPRARAREAAFQILFHWDVNPQFPLGAVERFLWESVREPEAVQFAQELIRGVADLCERLDEEIQSVSENWTVARMSVADRTILRLGTYELLYTDTPSEVIIDQAVELAKRYGTEQSRAFVNGILDRLMHKLRGAEDSRNQRSKRPGRSKRPEERRS